MTVWKPLQLVLEELINLSFAHKTRQVLTVLVPCAGAGAAGAHAAPAGAYDVAHAGAVALVLLV